jgi:hypothetical protein
MKKIFVVLLTCLSFGVHAQDNKEIDNLIPFDYVNQTFKKPMKMIMGIGSSVNINIVADLDDTDACQPNSISTAGLKMDLAWYNPNDETGKMMLSMLKDLGAIEQNMESFKQESGFEISEAREEEFSGGKLWIITSQKPCINEISGPTGITQYNTHLRYFLFNGTTITKIEIEFLGKPDVAKEMLGKMVTNLGKFNFSMYKNVIYQGS